MTPAEQAAQVQEEWLKHPCWTEPGEWGATAKDVLNAIIAQAIERARQEAFEEAAATAEARCARLCARIGSPIGSGDLIMHALSCDEGEIAAAIRARKGEA